MIIIGYGMCQSILPSIQMNNDDFDYKPSFSVKLLLTIFYIDVIMLVVAVIYFLLFGEF